MAGDMWQSLAETDGAFGGEEVCTGLPAVETPEPYEPLPRGAFGVHGGVVETEHLADGIEAFWWLTSRCVRHTRFPS